ncbi:MAG TPA: diguanylate cyclase [Acidobacteriaceae bacterium]|nr:diguanylate cyclase [Acidobacteriaceae bacterium]
MSNAITVSTSPIVLVGSANERLAEILGSTLESWHYQVEPVQRGEDALARLDGLNPPSIALLDMDLPEPSAAEVVWEVRRRQEQRRTWNILLSERRDSERVRAALQSGADDFLVFPAESTDSSDLRVRLRVAERVVALTSRIQKQSSELRYHATHDSLTGLWSREALISLIFQETDRVQRMKTPLSLMLLDLDDFSRINHDYGYETGDRILMEVASRFRRQLRSYDLIGRAGEDEFLLALPGCSLENALHLAGRIRETLLGRPFATDRKSAAITASIGVAASGGRSPMVVLREAERALAEAKLSGKDCARGDAPEAWLTQPVLAAGVPPGMNGD